MKNACNYDSQKYLNIKFKCYMSTLLLISA